MADAKLPEGSILRIEMEVRLPTAATEQEVGEWLKHYIAQLGSIKLVNPLIDREPEAWAGAFDWRYTGEVGRQETFDHQKTENGETYRVRYLREHFIPS